MIEDLLKGMRLQANQTIGSQYSQYNSPTAQSLLDGLKTELESGNSTTKSIADAISDLANVVQDLPGFAASLSAIANSVSASQGIPGGAPTGQYSVSYFEAWVIPGNWDIKIFMIGKPENNTPC